MRFNSREVIHFNCILFKKFLTENAHKEQIGICKYIIKHQEITIYFILIFKIIQKSKTHFSMNS